MYVIRYYNKTGGTVSGFVNDSSHYIPADMCTFSTADATTGYNLTQVKFYSGHAAGVVLSPLADDNSNATFVKVTFGYIGKSGRLVAMSNETTSGLDA